MKELNFDEKLEMVISILKDKFVTFEGKEKVYHDFLEEYPYFDSCKLDKYMW